MQIEKKNSESLALVKTIFLYSSVRPTQILFTQLAKDYNTKYAIILFDFGC